MEKEKMNSKIQNKHLPPWVPLFTSLLFVLGHVRILGWSLLLVGITAGLTWGGYIAAIDLVNMYAGSLLRHPPVSAGIYGWLMDKGWLVLHFFFLLVTRVVSFYLAFLVAYCLTSPGYVFLSTATEKIYQGESFTFAAGDGFRGIAIDMLEGCKIGLVGIFVTIIALFANGIPLVGPVLVLLIYIFYSALMFVDYPASRTRWSLGRKIGWVKQYPGRAFRLGIFPAFVSMVPVLNIFLMALLFPLFTVHTTLNFIAIERRHGVAKKQGEY